MALSRCLLSRDSFRSPCFKWCKMSLILKPGLLISPSLVNRYRLLHTCCYGLVTSDLFSKLLWDFFKYLGLMLPKIIVHKRLVAWEAEMIMRAGDFAVSAVVLFLNLRSVSRAPWRSFVTRELTWVLCVVPLPEGAGSPGMVTTGAALRWASCLNIFVHSRDLIWSFSL